MIERLPDKRELFLTASSIENFPMVILMYDRIDKIIDAVNSLELAIRGLQEVSISEHGP